MDKNKRKAPLLVGVVMLAICLLVQPLQARGQGQGVSEQVLLPNQEYSESSEDIAVKALGGRIRIRRSWVAGQWYLNPAWASLRFVPDPLGGVLAINRAGASTNAKAALLARSATNSDWTTSSPAAPKAGAGATGKAAALTTPKTDAYSPMPMRRA